MDQNRSIEQKRQELHFPSFLDMKTSRHIKVAPAATIQLTSFVRVIMQAVVKNNLTVLQYRRRIRRNSDNDFINDNRLPHFFKPFSAFKTMAKYISQDSFLQSSSFLLGNNVG